MTHYYLIDKDRHLAHSGVKGMKWGVRRYQNYDGTYTPEGLERYWPNSKHGTRGGLIKNMTLDRRHKRLLVRNEDSLRKLEKEYQGRPYKKAMEKITDFQNRAWYGDEKSRSDALDKLDQYFWSGDGTKLSKKASHMALMAMIEDTDAWDPANAQANDIMRLQSEIDTARDRYIAEMTPKLVGKTNDSPAYEASERWTGSKEYKKLSQELWDAQKAYAETIASELGLGGNDGIRMHIMGTALEGSYYGHGFEQLTDQTNDLGRKRKDAVANTPLFGEAVDKVARAKTDAQKEKATLAYLNEVKNAAYFDSYGVSEEETNKAIKPWRDFNDTVCSTTYDWYFSKGHSPEISSLLREMKKYDKLCTKAREKYGWGSDKAKAYRRKSNEIEWEIWGEVLREVGLHDSDEARKLTADVLVWD